MLEQKHIYNSPTSKAKRKRLRTESTPAEIRLWLLLKGKQLEGVKFRRQFGVGPYILDFYSPSVRVCIEVDGEVHYDADAVEYDEARTAYLEAQDIVVLRFENCRVFDEPERVLDEIRRVIHDRERS